MAETTRPAAPFEPGVRLQLRAAFLTKLRRFLAQSATRRTFYHDHLCRLTAQIDVCFVKRILDHSASHSTVRFQFITSLFGIEEYAGTGKPFRTNPANDAADNQQGHASECPKAVRFGTRLEVIEVPEVHQKRDESGRKQKSAQYLQAHPQVIRGLACFRDVSWHLRLA